MIMHNSIPDNHIHSQEYSDKNNNDINNKYNDNNKCNNETKAMR